jgi:RNA polymerase sigma-70 factor (ECF subfamily)
MSPEELDALLARFRAELSRRLARALPREHAAALDDLVQDASIRLWQALAGERKIVSSASYLHRVAANATIDALRRHRARREEPLPEGDPAEAPAAVALADPGADPERAAAGRERVARLQAALAALAPERRRAVRLHLQGFTTLEIGELCGWSEPKARNLAYRALEELRERLAEVETRR